MSKELLAPLWRWMGSVAISAIFAIGWWMFRKSVGDQAMLILLQALGVGLMVFAAGTMVVWLGYTVWYWLPAQRLKRLAPELESARTDLWNMLVGVAKSDASVRHFPKIRKAIHDLNRLKIPHPGLDGSAGTWDGFIMRLLGAAKAGSIAEARTILKEIEKIPNVIQRYN